ncbi:hypothetical protein LCGC14_0416860 [marine sediment metagenome]|uniref:Terminase small subunit n=1 Tax=marine sediment metagenome TaxID=412755 RepID=A0A0F9TA79_9ZZZZ
MAILKNSKYEIFARGIASGKSPHDSGIDAGFRDGPGLAVTTSRLVHKANIASRIEELKQLAADGTVMTIQKRLERLTEIAELPITKDIKARESVQAVAELNKMTVNAYPPAKVEVETGKELTEFLKGLRGYGNRKE